MRHVGRRRQMETYTSSIACTISSQSDDPPHQTGTLLAFYLPTFCTNTFSADRRGKTAPNRAAPSAALTAPVRTKEGQAIKRHASDISPNLSAAERRPL